MASSCYSIAGDNCEMASGNGHQEWREETIHVDDLDLTLIKGGSGRPLLVLHEELGWPGWLKWNSTLAQRHLLLIPQHPGFGRTPRSEWISSVRDLAGFYARYLAEQNLAPIDVIGFSLGGWIAAEMAACNPDQFRRIVLVAPCGIRPNEGEIRDIFQMMAPDQLRNSVLDYENTPEFTSLFGGIGPEQFELWEDARAQTARLAVFEQCGHRPEIEKLADFLRETQNFLA